MSMLTAMEPFLNMLGYGWFSMRASPFCGFLTCLLNTDRSFISYPMSRLFQFDKLFNDLKTVLPRLQDGKIGLLNATKLKKVEKIKNYSDFKRFCKNALFPIRAQCLMCIAI
jgi:hypothetical protein